MGIKTTMQESMHVLYDPDGSKLRFNKGGSVENYLKKGFLLKPPSKADAKAVRDAKAKRDVIAAAATKAAQQKIDDDNEIRRRNELAAQESRIAKAQSARESAVGPSSEPEDKAKGKANK